MAIQHAALPEVERLSASVIRILAGNPGKYTLQGTNTYLIGRGPSRLLIDTGEGLPSWTTHIKALLTSENATITTALLTHWHYDHVNGVPELRRICPGVRVYKNDPDEGDGEEGGQLGIEDGQEFRVEEGVTLKAVFTPGHTMDHMAFLLVEEGAMFTGDNVLGHGTAVFEDLKTYLSSLEKLQHSFSGRAYPGHGAVIEDGKSRIIQYIQHRQQRENEVLRVLKFGTLAEGKEEGEAAVTKTKDWTPLELVKVIYKDVPESLHLPASQGVAQVLRKLEGEGKVGEDEGTGKWRLNGRSAL
ncbi:hypothetical protein FQN54_004685 [Arachnomyces sp. PD_36]|nr:hypothetical protein FQN54_004685 [Arachnomyces sp. PD_36]